MVIEETSGLSLGLLRALLAEVGLAHHCAGRTDRPVATAATAGSFAACSVRTWNALRPLGGKSNCWPSLLRRLTMIKCVSCGVAADGSDCVRESIDAGYFSAYGADLYGSLAEELDERRPNVTLPPHVI